MTSTLHDHAQPGDSPARITIEHSADGTTATFEKDDLVVRQIVKDAGFRWSRNLGAWYLNSTWGEATRRERVGRVTRRLEDSEVELHDGGIAPQTTAAEREERARERAAERADRLEGKADRLAAASDDAYARERQIGDMIPFGQPILVGHHSQRRAENDVAKMRALATKSAELAREAEATERSAAIAARAADGATPLTRLRRIERKKAEVRDLDRRIERGSSEEYRARMGVLRATLLDEIAHDEAMVEASGRRVIGRGDVEVGDVVIARGYPRKVVRVNPKSVSVPTLIGNGAWTDTVPYLEITRVIKPGEPLPEG